MATLTKTFDYEAIDAHGKRSKGKLDGIERVRRRVVAACTGRRSRSTINEAGTGLQREISLPGRKNHVSLKDLAIFARQFATMTSSGLSLLRSLAVLEEQTTKPVLHKAIRDVRRDIESGLSLSGAMAKQDKIFPRLMIAMVRAGETGGFLDSALDSHRAELREGRLAAREDQVGTDLSRHRHLLQRRHDHRASSSSSCRSSRRCSRSWAATAAADADHGHA